MYPKYPKTSLYWKDDLEKKVKIYCIDHDIRTVNDFIIEAVKEKLEREGYLKSSEKSS